MADVPTFIKRPTAILKMPEALARGLTASAFLKELQAQGLGYRKTTFLADWRSVAGIEAKKDVAKYVRRDRRPSIKAIADVEWELSKEYMYKVKVWTQIEPDKPLEERFVNIMSDTLLTPTQLEAQVFSKWGEWERYAGEELKRVQLSAIMHRIEILEE